MKAPKFRNLNEEKIIGDNHDSTDYLDDFQPAPEVVFVRPKKEVISLRLEPQVIHKLREVADKEGLSPTSLARMLIIWRLRAQSS